MAGGSHSLIYFQCFYGLNRQLDHWCRCHPQSKKNYLSVNVYFQEKGIVFSCLWSLYIVSNLWNYRAGDTAQLAAYMHKPWAQSSITLL